jgi:hypothetical protein
MSIPPIMDAGPGLNFFSVNQERLLFSVLGPLQVPETVHGEMLRKSRTDDRFHQSETVLKKIPQRLLEVLSDDATGPLTRHVERISGLPLRERLALGKDLGETMVVAHAALLAESGSDVIVLIDDRGGQRMASMEARRLDRVRLGGTPAGHLQIITTLTVLERSIRTDAMPDKKTMRDLYERICPLDDGLPHIDSTNLLTSSRWNM